MGLHSLHFLSDMKTEASASFPREQVGRFAVLYAQRMGTKKAQQWRDGVLTIQKFHGSLVDEETGACVKRCSSTGLLPCKWYQSLVHASPKGLKGTEWSEGGTVLLCSALPVYSVQIQRVLSLPDEAAVVRIPSPLTASPPRLEGRGGEGSSPGSEPPQWKTSSRKRPHRSESVSEERSEQWSSWRPFENSRAAEKSAVQRSAHSILMEMFHQS